MIELQEVQDVDTLMLWRAEVVRAVFGQEPDANLLSANRNYYRHALASGNHLAFVAMVDGEEAGCGGLCLYTELPSPDNPTGKCAYLMNIYVRRQFRHLGVASAIVRHLIQEAKSVHCGKIYLESTTEALSLYISIGFAPMKNYLKYVN